MAARWRKILYERQPFPDNHFDDTAFLAGLVTNASFERYDLARVVLQSAAVTQQLAATAAFVAVFAYAQSGLLSAEWLVGVDVLLAAVGLLVSRRSLSSLPVAPMAVVFAAIYGLSPALGTLASPLSTDTALYCSAFALVVHLYAHQYAPGAPESPVALNAAVLAGLLLASRLPSATHVFAFVSYAIELFALAPLLRLRGLKGARASGWSHDAKRAVVGLATAACAFYIVWTLSVRCALVFASAIVFTSLVCPLWLVHIQKYKMEINGPWDEAVPSVSPPPQQSDKDKKDKQRK
eukprot:m51a1_g1023 hypothetical protein (294) ;mRNA; r:646866-648085